MKNSILIFSFLLASLTLNSCVERGVPSNSETRAIIETSPLTAIVQSSLDNTGWYFMAFRVNSSMTQSESMGNIYLIFTDNSTCGGNIGRASYHGKVTIRGNNITFDNLVTNPVKLEDNPPGFQKQGYDYLSLLKNSKTYTIDNRGELVINCENGHVLVYRSLEE